MEQEMQDDEKQERTRGQVLQNIWTCDVSGEHAHGIMGRGQ